MQTERRVVNTAPVISWGSIFAGTVVLLVSAMILSTLGASLGLMKTDINQVGATARILGRGALIWTMVAAVTSTFIGAFVSGRLAGSAVKMDASLHGIITWSLAMLIVVCTLTAVTGAFLSNVFGLVGRGATGIGQAARNINMNMLPPQIRQEIQNLFGEPAAGEQGISNDETLQTFFDILRDPMTITQAEKNQIAQIVAQRMNITTVEALDRINTTLKNMQAFVKQAKIAAETTTQATGKAAMVGFLIQMISVLVAAWGGVVGAKSIPSIKSV